MSEVNTEVSACGELDSRAAMDYYLVPDEAVPPPEFNPENGMRHNQMYNTTFSMFWNHPDDSEYYGLTGDAEYRCIAFNHRYHIVSAEQGKVYDSVTKQIVDKNVFVKYSPLLDPFKYMVGKYKPVDDPMLRTLPSPPPLVATASPSPSIHPKLAHSMNSSYVDCFFYYLSSMLLHQHGFVHGIDFYGSYLGIQDEFRMNIEEDVEYLANSAFFMSNIGKLMALEHCEHTEFADTVRRIGSEREEGSEGGGGSRHCKRTISILPDADVDVDICIEPIDMDVEPIEMDVDMDVDVDNSISEDKLLKIHYGNEGNDNIISIGEGNDNSSDNSEGNDSEGDDSDNSEGDDSDDSEGDDSEGEDNSNSEGDHSEDSEDDEGKDSPMGDDYSPPIARIFRFPTQAIHLERCTGTLDDLLDKQTINPAETQSAFFQIVMILLVYQRTFNFTHNDLHTNNIMYVSTDIPYLWYHFQGITYRVPTYGRLYKLIDYGRSIYTFRGRKFCSDSFAQGGDGATQYNCEPFLNPNKPRLDPNPSFDLCRLGCSIYDFLGDEDEEEEDGDLKKTIQRWCTSDSGVNMLYKSNGSERFPGFKLYKMIARMVHQHTPAAQLSHAWFQAFVVAKDSGEKPADNEPYMNLHTIPVYTYK